jgi:hypothetical protein
MHMCHVQKMTTVLIPVLLGISPGDRALNESVPNESALTLWPPPPKSRPPASLPNVVSFSQVT